MSAVIVSVNNKVSLPQFLSQLRIPAHMLAKSMGDLNDSANGVMTVPFHARDGKAVSTYKLKSLRRVHYISTIAT